MGGRERRKALVPVFASPAEVTIMKGLPQIPVESLFTYLRDCSPASNQVGPSCRTAVEKAECLFIFTPKSYAQTQTLGKTSCFSHTQRKLLAMGSPFTQ